MCATSVASTAIGQQTARPRLGLPSQVEGLQKGLHLPLSGEVVTITAVLRHHGAGVAAMTAEDPVNNGGKQVPTLKK